MNNQTVCALRSEIAYHLRFAKALSLAEVGIVLRQSKEEVRRLVAKFERKVKAEIEAEIKATMERQKDCCGHRECPNALICDENFQRLRELQERKAKL